MSPKKQLLDTFQKSLENSFENYCDRHHSPDNIGCFITYLIDHNLIETSTIKRYTILKEFDTLYSQNGNHKTLTVKTLASKYNVSERSVWTVLKDHFYRYDENKI